MRRRDFIALIGGAAALRPIAADAQQDDRVRALQIRILRLQAEGAAEKISQFIREILDQMGWTTQLTWSASTIEQRRFDGLRLLRQVPAIAAFSQLDASGKEQHRVSRLLRDLGRDERDYSHDPKFTEAVAKKVYYGPVYFGLFPGGVRCLYDLVACRHPAQRRRQRRRGRYQAGRGRGVANQGR
jgi:hypothetical protein